MNSYDVDEIGGDILLDLYTMTLRENIRVWSYVEKKQKTSKNENILRSRGQRNREERTWDESVVKEPKEAVIVLEIFKDNLTVAVRD